MVVMGVSGSGKSTLGRLLAGALDAAFVDADDHHTPENVARMRAGIALTDSDRAGWLGVLNALLRQAHGQRIVLACSALRHSYREALSTGLPQPPVFIYLKGSEAVLRKRLERRAGHFMPPGLLRSQLDTLEEPGDAIVIGIDEEPDAQLRRALAALRAMA